MTLYNNYTLYVKMYEWGLCMRYNVSLVVNPNV